MKYTPHSTFHIPHSTKGFTLVETLVAISILLLSVAGPLTIASQGVSSSRVAREQITAIFLAQEAIEHVRNIRDGNSLTRDPWLTGLELCAGATCTIDTITNDVAVCPGICPPLQYNDATGLYGHSVGSDSPFTRSVVITIPVSGIEAQVSATVSWQTGSRTRTFTVREQLFNWQQ